MKHEKRKLRQEKEKPLRKPTSQKASAVTKAALLEN